MADFTNDDKEVIATLFANLVNVSPSEVSVLLAAASVQITITVSVPTATRDSALVAIGSRLNSPSAATTFFASVHGGLVVEAIDLPPVALTNDTRIDDPSDPLILNLTDSRSALAVEQAGGGNLAPTIAAVVIVAALLICGIVVWKLRRHKAGRQARGIPAISSYYPSTGRRALTQPTAGIPSVVAASTVSATSVQHVSVLPEMPVVDSPLQSPSSPRAKGSPTGMVQRDDPVMQPGHVTMVAKGTYMQEEFDDASEFHMKI